METFIALLRGINVSGQKLIKMKDLSRHFENLGFEAVQTYIQSGNIIFNARNVDSDSLKAKIERKIYKEYTFDVPAIVKTKQDLHYALSHNPFFKRGEDPDYLYFTFLSQVPKKEYLNSIQQNKFLPEEIKIQKDLIYLFSPKGYGKAKMNNNYFENKLKVNATTRNWKTVNKLFEMASSAV